MPPPIQNSMRASHYMPKPPHNKKWDLFRGFSIESIPYFTMDTVMIKQIVLIKSIQHPKLGSIKLPLVIPIGTPKPPHKQLLHVPCTTMKVWQKRLRSIKSPNQVDRCRSIHTKMCSTKLPERIWSVGFMTVHHHTLVTFLLFNRVCPLSCYSPPIKSD